MAYNDDVVLHRAKLHSEPDRVWFLLSRKASNLKDYGGEHLIVHAGHDHESQLCDEVKAELMGIAYLTGRKMSPSGRFRIAVNGPGLQAVARFEIHLFIVAEGVEVMRLTDPIVLLGPMQ